jgi:GH15 family glucan-1,4-alpha-glucosidase
MSAYPPISDYALIGDCHGAALVSRSGSIDWLCMPRMDSASAFGRMLDWERGGHCSIEPVGDGAAAPTRRYTENTLVLETELETEEGSATVTDLMEVSGDLNAPEARHELLRIITGRHGALRYRIEIVPRFDYGEVEPLIQHHGAGRFGAMGGSSAMLISSDASLELVDGRTALCAEGVVQAGESAHLSILACSPEEIEGLLEKTSDGTPASRLGSTVDWWQSWSKRVTTLGPDPTAVLRSTAILRALTYGPTGGIAAAATTSLPEVPGGSRNWDYRLSWVRDSALAVRSLAEIGCEDEAHGFREFVQRSAGGQAAELQVAFGIGGERDSSERELDLDGYGGARPVRVGNSALDQLQLDAYGHLVEQSWRWFQRGHSPDDDYWRFIVDLVEYALERWQEKDAGIWEFRDKPRHFVHSKAMCWAAADRGIRLAEACMRRAPTRRWAETRDEIREEIESKGFNKTRNTFVQAFGFSDLDAAVLRLPTIGFLEFDDERMVGTADAIRDELCEDGFVRRYNADDGLPGKEGTFVCCTFWLAEVLARQRRVAEAREVFDRAVATANDLGLFAEEYDPGKNLMLGNYPQGLSHLSHLEAAIALDPTVDPPG